MKQSFVGGAPAAASCNYCVDDSKSVRNINNMLNVFVADNEFQNFYSAAVYKIDKFAYAMKKNWWII